MQQRYLVIADDFTGANDTGVQIRRRGIPVEVVFSVGSLRDTGVSCVIDTESRALSPTLAAAAVTRALTGVDTGSFHHCIKKVDSTLRGNLGAEIAAADAVLKPELLLFAPALPDLDRTTEHGIQLLNGTPITQTEMARDPRTPVSADNITALLQEAFAEPVQHIPLEAVAKGPVSFEGGRVFTADAASNQHLRALVQSALATGKRVLWVGAAALADALLESEHQTFPALGVITSLSAVTNQQLLFAQDQGIALVPVPIAQLLRRQLSREEIADQAAVLLQQGRDVILHSAASLHREEALADARLAAAEAGLTPEEESAYIQKTIGEIARHVLGAATVSGAFLTGGDTAVSFFEAVGATGSRIETEIAVGIPLMRLCGGSCSGLKVVTKAGAFGQRDAITFALRKLKEADH